MRGERAMTATERTAKSKDAGMLKIKSQLKKAMHSPHGLDVAGFIKRHDHDLSGWVNVTNDNKYTAHVFWSLNVVAKSISFSYVLSFSFFYFFCFCSLFQT